MSSCKEDLVKKDQNIDNYENISTLKNIRDRATVDDEKEMVLGKKLQNPYTVENMEKALKNLSNSIENKRVKVRVTHKYVRFLPHNEEEFAQLLRIKDLELFNHPLDYEIIESGNRYKDPSVKDSPYTWYYAVVENDYKLPKKIKNEVISDLYLPEKDESLKEDIGLIQDLENEALKLTGNYISTKKNKITSWHPSGNIWMYDDTKASIIPVVGCKVRTQRWFSIETALTDVNGHYEIAASYNNPCNYEIYWSRADFDILDNDVNVAKLTGPQSIISPWSVTINSGRNLVFATIHRAAYEYYYHRTGTVTNLFAPPYTRISYENSSNYRPGLSLQYNPGGYKIKIWTNVQYLSSYRERSHLETFGTVIHELGHAAHFTYNQNGYDFGSAKLAESWGEAVKWAFSIREYGKWGNYNSGNYSSSTNFSDNYQRTADNISQGGNLDYTPIGVDLFDNHNQEFQEYGVQSPVLANDAVSGITIDMFQWATFNNSTWSGARDYLKNNFAPTTTQKANLDLLFNEW